MPRPSPLQNAFARLWQRGIGSRLGLDCCSSCARAEASRIMGRMPGIKAYVFFNVVEMQNAAESGLLTLSIELSERQAELPGGVFEVSYDVFRELRKGHIDVSWEQRLYMDVFLSPRDWQWLRDMVEQEEQEWNEMIADEHFKSRTLDIFSQETRKRKRATRVIGHAVCEWASRPEGVLTRRCKRRFEGLQKTVL